MPERCTCGAQLPPDALFCHKCGKLQRESLPEEVAEAPPPLPDSPVSSPAPPPIGFHNGIAVRIALFAGILSLLVSALTGRLAPPLAVVWLIAAGFLAVFLYRRRTGERLSALSGARLGWISGIFGFVILTIILTIFAVALSEPSMASAVREQWHQHGQSETDWNQIIEALRTPAGIAGTLLTSFLLFTILPALGGAVGAKLLDRD